MPSENENARPFARWRPHPWHGLSAGPSPPEKVHAYIEMTPLDVMKYEIDKETGYMRVDRPQRTSSQPPTLYGFIPQTYCGSRVAALSPMSTGGDGDPLDICVISERPVTRAEVVVNARVIGGLQMIDQGESDDKIVSVLEDDPAWEDITDLNELPDPLVERLRHYFNTYKWTPQEGPRGHVAAVYGASHAFDVIRASIEDYQKELDVK